MGKDSKVVSPWSPTKTSFSPQIYLRVRLLVLISLTAQSLFFLAILSILFRQKGFSQTLVSSSVLIEDCDFDLGYLLI